MNIDGFDFREEDNKIYFIADIGLCHNGSVDIAKKLIDVGIDAGVNAVKFQKRTVSELAVNSVLDARDDRFPNFGSTYREIREHVEFGEREYNQIFKHARQKDITCFATPFDITAVDFLEKFNPPAYKLASHSITDTPLVEYVAELGKPVILSSGMVEWNELDDAVRILKKSDVDYAILHCVSSYPTSITEANLRLIDKIRSRYNCVVGYSGHETDHIITLAAAARGARIIERHITLDHGMKGFDHRIAMDPDELKHYVLEIRKIEKALGDGVKKITDAELQTRRKYSRSIASRKKLKKGNEIKRGDLVMLNPGTGISPKELPEVIGRKAREEIRKHTLISWEMLE